MIGRLLEMNTFSVEIVLLSTRVNEQLFSDLRQNTDWVQSLESSKEIDVIGVRGSQI